MELPIFGVYSHVHFVLENENAVHRVADGETLSPGGHLSREDGACPIGHSYWKCSCETGLRSTLCHGLYIILMDTMYLGYISSF